LTALLWEIKFPNKQTKLFFSTSFYHFDCICGLEWGAVGQSAGDSQVDIAYLKNGLNSLVVDTGLRGNAEGLRLLRRFAPRNDNGLMLYY
jgi:hypothetical protein